MYFHTLSLLDACPIYKIDRKPTYQEAIDRTNYENTLDWVEENCLSQGSSTLSTLENKEFLKLLTIINHRVTGLERAGIRDFPVLIFKNPISVPDRKSTRLNSSH